MTNQKLLQDVAERVESTFRREGVRLTLGGEPTYVPVDPVGPEWSITALGPTKLRYGYALADALIAGALPHAVPIYSPGKQYPGEVNPRWSINLLWNRNDTPLTPAMALPQQAGALPTLEALQAIERDLLELLGLAGGWLRAVHPTDPSEIAAVLPLDHDGARFVSADWGFGRVLELLPADGPAGLRLPLQRIPEGISRRALTLSIREGHWEVFLAPLLQGPLLETIEYTARAVAKAGGAPIAWSGYLPLDEAGIWERMAIAADPGVLEVNLPACYQWKDYAHWLEVLEKAAAAAGLRSFKRFGPGDESGTGGGNHLLFGGPSLDENPLFTHPAWVAALLRYWQHHPSLAYLFTGIYVGSSSQAPRPDESASALYDLEMGYQFLEQLPPGDHRYLISETLRHLHTDLSGNTHRSESSFDKFWNVNFDGGCRGLVEFRAIESFPRADWMAAIALLWRALAAWLLEHPFTEPLLDHGGRLHDAFFLPSGLWSDFQRILVDLREGGYGLPESLFREIAEWRFPLLLNFSEDGAELTVRKALESWPLLCEQPLEGGTTSRFVDTSIERLEFAVNAEFAARWTVRVQGRNLPLDPLPDGRMGAGLRYRRTALYPSLHPGIPPQLPLWVCLSNGDHAERAFQLVENERQFTAADPALAPSPSAHPCRKLQPGLLTCDLRLP